MWSQVATLPLAPAVVDAVAPVPVIAAGGIGDARGVAAEPGAPLVGTTGDVEALSLWAGQSVGLARHSKPAAEIVAELVSRL